MLKYFVKYTALFKFKFIPKYVIPIDATVNGTVLIYGVIFYRDVHVWEYKHDESIQNEADWILTLKFSTGWNLILPLLKSKLVKCCLLKYAYDSDPLDSYVPELLMHLLSLIKTCERQKNKTSYLIQYVVLCMLSEHTA